MRRIWGFAAFILLGCAACSSSGTTGTPASTAPLTTAQPTVSVPPPTRSAPSSDPVHSSGDPAPPHPARPTVPGDVPRTGPNTHKGEKPPVEPLEATQHTSRGAKAFAAFFIKTIDWGYATTSSAYMRHYSMAGCSTCQNFANLFDQAKRNKWRFEGARITTHRRQVGPHPLVKGAQLTIIVKFDIESFAEVNRSGHAVRVDGHLQADQAHRGYSFDVSLQWRHHGWIVDGLAVDT